MSFAGSPEPESRSSTPASETSSVRVALDRFWAALDDLGFERAAPARIREALAPVVAQARAAGIPPERLVVLLKESWRAQPDDRAWLRDGSPRAEIVLERTVTLAIREFFRGDGGTDRGASGPSVGMGDPSRE